MKTLLASTARILVVLGLIVAAFYLGSHPQYLPVKTQQALQTSVYDEGRQLIASSYYKKLSQQQLDENALKGVASLDPYSEYITGQDLQQFKLAGAGQYAGIGVTLERKMIVAVAKNSPAANAGLRSGDAVVSVGGKQVAAMTALQLANSIRGPVNTQVKLIVQRKQRRLQFVLVRKPVAAPIVESKLLGQHVGYVALHSFSSGSSQQVKQAVDKLLRSGRHNIVLDLRDNGGGQVTEAVDMASLFLPVQTTVVTLKTRQSAQTFRTDSPPVDLKSKLVVLTNANTASASEILAAALREHHRAKLVGQHTYGKGVFQNTFNVGSGLLKLTVGQFYTPNGRNLGHGTSQGSGLAPDVKVTDIPDHPGDEQLNAALNVLR